MALAGLDDMLLAIGEDTLRAIADHDGDRVIDDDVVAQVLEDASDVVRSYVPADLVPHLPAEPEPAPPMLRRVTVMIAVQLLRETRDMTTEASERAYDRSLKWLEALAAGRVQLVGVDVPPEAETYLDPGDPEAEGQPRIWNRASAGQVF